MNIIENKIICNSENDLNKLVGFIESYQYQDFNKFIHDKFQIDLNEYEKNKEIVASIEPKREEINEKINKITRWSKTGRNKAEKLELENLRDNWSKLYDSVKIPRDFNYEIEKVLFNEGISLNKRNDYKMLY